MTNMETEEDNLLLVAIGNPNVDVTIVVYDTYFFERYNLPCNGQTPVSAELLKTLENDIKRRKLHTILSPGGCAQNSLRVFQWLINSKYKSAMIGTIGMDEQSSYLKRQIEADGLRTCFSELNDQRTSSVFVFVHKNCRSAVYDTIEGAAVKYSLGHLLNHTNALPYIKKAKIVHTEGFFTFHSPEVGLKIIETCIQLNTVTSFNLCGKYVVKEKAMTAVIPFVETCNVVIGNKEEFEELCHALKIPTDETEKAAYAVHELMLSQKRDQPKEYKIKNMNKYEKILIVTDGEKDVLCLTGADAGDSIKYKVPEIKASEIKDTTGAGDAFLAGFLYGILQELPLRRCLEIANSTAKEIIHQSGCTIPSAKPDFITNIVDRC